MKQFFSFNSTFLSWMLPLFNFQRTSEVYLILRDARNDIRIELNDWSLSQWSNFYELRLSSLEKFTAFQYYKGKFTELCFGIQNARGIL